MCERILIENGAPTLANMKTASLFTLPILEEKSQFAWKKTLETKGIKIMVLRTKGKNQLIYMYRPEKLRQDLTNPMAACILCRAGYQYQTEKEALQILKKRIAQSSEFPHEIGLFWGIRQKMSKDLWKTGDKIASVLDAGRCMEMQNRQKNNLPDIKNAEMCICGCFLRGEPSHS